MWMLFLDHFFSVRNISTQILGWQTNCSVFVLPEKDNDDH